jgi:hypothetical protein
MKKKSEKMIHLLIFMLKLRKAKRKRDEIFVEFNSIEIHDKTEIRTIFSLIFVNNHSI